MTDPTINYFGFETVDRAIENYFMKHGITEEVRDDLMVLGKDGDAFFQMVADFVEKE